MACLRLVDSPSALNFFFFLFFSSLILLFSLFFVPILISDENERKREENRSINLLPVYYLIGISAVDTHPTPEFVLNAHDAHFSTPAPSVAVDSTNRFSHVPAPNEGHVAKKKNLNELLLEKIGSLTLGGATVRGIHFFCSARENELNYANIMRPVNVWRKYNKLGADSMDPP